MNKTYTVKQVAGILGYSTNSVYTFLKEGRIKGVRIGKGRFRIPQEELEKLLYLKKFQEPQSVSLGGLVPINENIPSLVKHLEEMIDNIPSLFDWFVSLVSIIIGFTMILFVRNFEEFSNIGFTQFLLPIKINFLIAGVGLFTVNVLNRARKNWYFIFNLIIFLNLSAFSLMLFLGKDLLGFVIFGLLSVVMFFHFLLNPKGIISFALYVSLLTIFFPIILIIYPSVINLPEIPFFSIWPPAQTALAWLILASGVNGVIWLFGNEKKPIFWMSLMTISVGLIYFSYLYSIQLYWSRALTFILIALLVVISSFWHRLDFNDKNTRRIIINTFSDLLLIFLAIITVIWIIQNNIRSYAQNELINKLVYGQSFVESTINSSREKLESLSQDQSLIEAVKKKDADSLKNLTKDLFVYSLNFRRILTADDEGNLLSIYPEVILPYKNVAFREYFQAVKTSKKNYFSNLFETQNDGVKKEVAVISVPILDEEENFIGVLIGSLDIDSLSNKLEQIASTNNKEYFLVIDREGSLIIKPRNINKISSEETNQLTIHKTKDNFDIQEVSNSHKLLQIHNQVSDTNWTIAIRRPLINTYNFDDSTNLMLNLMIVGAGLLIVFLNVVHLKR